MEIPTSEICAFLLKTRRNRVNVAMLSHIHFGQFLLISEEYVQSCPDTFAHLIWAVRSPSLAQTVTAPRFRWSFSGSVFGSLLVDHVVMRRWAEGMPPPSQVERGLPVGDFAHHARAPSDLKQDALRGPKAPHSSALTTEEEEEVVPVSQTPSETVQAISASPHRGTEQMKCSE